MKKDPAIKCSDFIPHRVIDQTAETAQEIQKASGMSRYIVDKTIADNMKSGRWERVYKVIENGSTRPAYRVKRK